MAFFSELMGRPIVDCDGKMVGKLQDLVAKFHPELAHPVISAIVIIQKGKKTNIPLHAVEGLIASPIRLKHQLVEIPPYQPAEQDILLTEDVLDKQIIDIDGARVVRVNDIELVSVNGMILMSNVDVGRLGILRRLGLAGPAQKLSTRFNRKIPQNYISWDYVELMGRDQAVRLKVPGEKISDLHPADIAEILSDLNHLESRDLLNSLDVEQLADALEEVEPDFQISLVAGMPDDQVADVLEEMDPDEAADLLAEFPKQRSEDLLALMEKDDADDVRKLLAYPEDTAGGIMTTEFASVNQNLTVEQAINSLRETADEAETIFYVYVTDEQEHLVGVFSLSHLIFADPQTPIAELARKRVISVQLYDKQEDIAQIVSKYDLLAVPVVDDDNFLHGIVTADDALDKIIPTAWKKRLPRFYR
jgi:magnesium transporter